MIQVRLLESTLAPWLIPRNNTAIVNSREDTPCIDTLANNACIIATDFAISPGRFESQLATSHPWHFLFASLILDMVIASQSPRIVSISSDGYRLDPIRWDDYF